MYIYDYQAEILIWPVAAFICWIIAVFSFIHLTKEKLGVRSDLLGIGMANMVVGFLWHEIQEQRIIKDIHWVLEVPVILWVMSFLYLILGLSGIILMAAGIMKSIKD